MVSGVEGRGGWGGMRSDFNEYGVSFGDEKTILELDSGNKCLTL